MNRRRQSKHNLLHRVCALVALLAWITASGYCSTEYIFEQLGLGGHHHDHAHDHGHHGTAIPVPEDAHHSHGPDPSGQHNHKDACCESLNSVAQNASFFQTVKADFGSVYLLTPPGLLQSLTLTRPEAHPLRQAKMPRWVFTPEVSLGPAFRSHAPPLVVA